MAGGIVANIPADKLNDLINQTLPFYIKNKLFKQNLDDRPTLKKMREVQGKFAGGPDIRLNVKGNYAPQGQWLDSDGPVTFRDVSGTIQAIYPWYVLHDGIKINYTDLKVAGYSVGDSGEMSEHSQRDMLAITNYLDTVYSDLNESMPMSIVDMMWRDGSTNASASPGIPFFISDTPAVGTVGGISRATSTFWRNRALVGVANRIAYSAANSTLISTLTEEGRQLRRFGSKPDFFVAGNKFMKALEIETLAKGTFTQTGFDKVTNVGVQSINVNGLGTVVYEPKLDDIGRQAFMYAIDTTKIKTMVMEGEEFKTHLPARPHNQFSVYKSVTWTGTLVAQQLNSSGVYEVNATGL